MDKNTRDAWEKLILQLHRIADSVSGEQGQHDDHAVGDQDRPDDDSGGTAFSSLVSPNLRPRPKKSKNANEKWYETLNGWKIRLEIVTFIFAIGYAVITFMQWRDANKNFRAGQRAWLMMEKVSIPHPFNSSETTPIEFVVKNFGQSPALHFKSHTDMSFSGRGCESVGIQRTPYNTESSVPPGGEEPWANLAVARLPQDCVGALEHGDASFTLTSSLVYEDIFGDMHHTNVRFRYEGVSSRLLTLSEYGNDLN
jgi:hypothetical protein